MKSDGSARKKLTNSETEIEAFPLSPDRSKVILIKSIPYYGTINKKPADLPKTTGLVITDMNYRHWDHYVQTIAHPYLADVTAQGIGEDTIFSKVNLLKAHWRHSGDQSNLLGAMIPRRLHILAGRKKREICNLNRL